MARRSSWKGKARSVLFLFVYVICLVPSIEWDNLLPVMEKGAGPVLRGAVSTTAYPFAELVPLLMIVPHVKNQLTLRSHYLKGALMGGGVIALIIFLSVAILGQDFAARNMYPSYALAKKIDIGHFLQRIEVTLAFIWLLTTFIKTSFYVYAFHVAFAQLFRLRQHKSFILPFGLLLVGFAVLTAPNINYFQHLNDFWPYMDFTIGIGLVVLLLAVSLVRGRRSGRES